MQNSGWIIGGIAVAALVATGVGFAMTSNNSSSLFDDGVGSVSAESPRGMTAAEMEARIAGERAAADARAQAKIECERERQEASNKGAIVGGAAGAAIGSNVAGNGAKSEGGVLGALAGATIGRDIAKEEHRC